MTEFDYVEHAGLRAALENDYKEMFQCMQIEAWKSAQVLAGSIVESLLMDFLVARPGDGAKASTLKLDLAEVIKLCQEEKAISERTANLCSVIRSYRNLIHPARGVRLGEPSPTKASSEIAVSLIDLIVTEVGATRRTTVGLTAEQVLGKVISDSKSGSLMKHLLADVRDSHLMRLATVLLPDALAQQENNFDDFGLEDRISKTFRAVLDALPPEKQTEVVDAFAILLRQGSEAEIDRYRRGLFRAPDINLASPQYREMIKDHLLGSLGVGVAYGDIRAAEGIGAFLKSEDVAVWTNTLVRVTLSKGVAAALKKRVRDFVVSQHFLTDGAFNDQVVERLGRTINRLEATGENTSAETLRDIKLEIELPF